MSNASIDLAGAFMKRKNAVSTPVETKEEPPSKPSNSPPEPSEMPQNALPKQKKTRKEPSWQAFTVICDKTIVRKVKAIARKEGLHVNAVVQAMYMEGISWYERKHGTIDPEAKHRSAKEVLFST